MIKQVIAIRSDLKMRRGKEAAQAAHASGECLWEKPQVDLVAMLIKWRQTGMTKICVRLNSEEELLALEAKAVESGIRCHVITDSGRTEFNGVPTKTCIALGPDEEERINLLTGNLKLY